MSKFTPGPWVVSGNKAGGFHIEGDGAVICSRADWTHRASESQANARLIAAAPLMYDALLRVLENGYLDNVPSSVKREAQAALAAAGATDGNQ